MWWYLVHGIPDRLDLHPLPAPSPTANTFPSFHPLRWRSRLGCCLTDYSLMAIRRSISTAAVFCCLLLLPLSPGCCCCCRRLAAAARGTFASQRAAAATRTCITFGGIPAHGHHLPVHVHRHSTPLYFPSPHHPPTYFPSLPTSPPTHAFSVGSKSEHIGSHHYLPRDSSSHSSTRSPPPPPPYTIPYHTYI